MSKSQILFFSSTWCNPCKRIKSELSKEIEDELNILSFDASQDFDAFSEYQVSSVPTIVKLVDNKETNRHVGYISTEDLKNL